MSLSARIALAFALSLAAAGAVQQAIMIADGAKGTASALFPPHTFFAPRRPAVS